MGLEGWLFRDSAWYSDSAFNLCSSHGHRFCRQVPETCEEDEFRAKYKTTKTQTPRIISVIQQAAQLLRRPI